MKLIYLITLLSIGSILSAQSFTEVSPAAPFEGVSASAVEFADIDGDNDLDVMIAGYNSSRMQKTSLYKNDGNGNYTLVPNTSFFSLQAGSTSFADIDGDNDLDLLITGKEKFDNLSILYKNDGNGNFLRDVNVPFVGVQYSKTAFADVDGDNDLDVLITGQGDNLPVAKLYINNGNGNYTEKANTPFTGVSYSATAFADIDGDSDLDVIITGGTSKLYTNDGSGNFTEVTNVPFDDVDKGGVAFADVDGDNDLDVLIIGERGSGAIAKLYLNDGQGNYTEKSNTPFVGLSFSDVSFSDVDGDGDKDVFIIGYYVNTMGFKVPVSRLYMNDGSGTFTEAMGMPFEGVYAGTVDFADVDGDNDPDVLLTGVASAKLYINNTMISSVDHELPGVHIHLYQEVSEDNALHVKISSEEATRLTIHVFDLNGKMLFSKQLQPMAGEQTHLLNTATWSSGSYLLQLDNGKQRVGRRFIVK